jgi:hypothetical protein
MGPPAGYREDMAWDSLGVVADAYTGKKELGLTWWATGDGWRRARARLTEWGGMALALAICRRDVPGFKIGGMKEVCGDVYAAVNTALAAGNTRALEQLCTPAMAHQLRVELERRRTAGWSRVDWRLAAPLNLWKVEFVSGRIIKTSAASRLSFCQFTFAIPSTQVYAAYGRGGALVAGDPGQTLQVLDHWVLERRVHDSISGQQLDVRDGRWRLAGRLSLPPPQ